MQPEHLTKEISALEIEHRKRFGFPANLMFAPDDPDLVAKRLRQALEEGIPWDTDKEFDDWLENQAPEWFRKGYKTGEILI
uniref:Uncharacterized protein n=1 Tax=Gracilinema caldarium TaxID=215591 RepID=A0A7C3HV76_9SPIR